MLEGHRKQRNGLDKVIYAEINKELKIAKNKFSEVDVKQKVDALLPNRLSELKAIQKQEIKKRFLAYLQKIEKDKLFYFVLAYSNPQKVLIVKSPSDNKEQKQFLGYEWSAAKGNEGIKLTTDAQGKHLTPLYDPENRYNPDKINTLIQQNFSGSAVAIPESLEPFASLVSLVDLLDFTRKDFDKHISLSVKKKESTEQFNDKYELKKISQIGYVKGGKRIPKGFGYSKEKTDYPYIRVSDFSNMSISTEKMLYISEETFLEIQQYTISKSDIYISIAGTIGLCGTVPDELDGKSLTENAAKIVIKNTQEINYKFLSLVLNYESVQQQISERTKGIGVPKLSLYEIEQLKIPQPPLDIQAQIVQECEAVDAEVEKAITEIEKAKKEIENETQNSINKEYPTKKLSDICTMQAGKFISASEIKDLQDKGLFPCYGGNGLRGYTKTFTHEGHFPLIGRQGALCGNVKIAQGQFYATEHAVGVKANADINVTWLYHQLKLLNLNQYATGVAQPGLSVQKILNISTTVPPIKEQENLVQQIETQEAIITAAQQIIDAAASKKQAILKQYL
ncbi:MAG: restriction endonuclease subunit S [Methylococcales bacterium]|nr:restriction endonuclease subunit S [Methylococcales bacterium]